MGIPALLAEALASEVLGTLLPHVNGRSIGEVRDCYSKPVDVADAFGARTAGLLEHELEHRAPWRRSEIVQKRKLLERV